MTNQNDADQTDAVCGPMLRLETTMRMASEPSKNGNGDVRDETEACVMAPLVKIEVTLKSVNKDTEPK